MCKLSVRVSYRRGPLLFSQLSPSAEPQTIPWPRSLLALQVLNLRSTLSPVVLTLSSDLGLRLN